MLTWRLPGLDFSTNYFSMLTICICDASFIIDKKYFYE